MSEFTIYRTNRLPNVGVTYIAVTSGRDVPDGHFGEYFILQPERSSPLQYGQLSCSQAQMDTYKTYDDLPPLDLEALALDEAVQTVWADLDSLPNSQKPVELGESPADVGELYALLLRDRCDQAVFSAMAEVTRNELLEELLRSVARLPVSLSILPAQELQF